MFTFCLDKERLYRHFQKDPVLFAYHIGDLDDFFFAQCQYPAIYDRTAKVDDAVLMYLGVETPTLMAFGLTDRFELLLTELRDVLPKKFFCHYFSRYRAILEETHAQNPFGTHLKMSLPNEARLPEVSSENMATLKQLDPSHAGELAAFYAVSYPDCYYHPRMLQTGKFVGCYRDSTLAAVAGVHVDSAQYKLTALGSIATHPDYRGQGLASLVTACLCHQLRAERKRICLNVKADNQPAVRCYENLGFVRTHEYEEGFFESRT